MGISALIILIFFVPYTASGFSACGEEGLSLYHGVYAMILQELF